MSYEPWIGVDLDGTLAYYDHWRGNDHIGAPIPTMLSRVKQWLREGKTVKIMTARACRHSPEELAFTVSFIELWCTIHIGQKLPVTATKDFGMVELWDDRAVQVIPNTGVRVDTIHA